MKYFVVFLVISCVVFGLTTPVHGEEQKQFQVTTKMNFPESIPAGKPVDFTIDVTYNGPYSWVKNLEPKFEIVPNRADYDVDIQYDDSISDYTIWKGHIHTLHGTMLVSEDTPFEAVFLSVSFEGMIRFDEEVVSVDPDSTISLSIGESAQESENPSHEGYVEWIGGCFMVGSDVVLRVTDPDMNRDSELVEELNVTMWSDNDDRNVAYALTETGKDTGIFDANVFFTTTDSSPGKRLRIVDGSTVYAKYVDYTSSESYNAIDVISSVATGLSVLERNTDGSISKITYDLCALEILMQNPDRFEQIDVFYPPPLKQFKSGVPVDEIQCNDGLVKVIKKSNDNHVCIKPETKSKLVQRGWIQFQFSFCGADGFDSKGNLNQSNSTHIWDENECHWQKISNVPSENKLPLPELPSIDSLHTDDILEIRHHEGNSVLEIHLSSWDDYKEWENSREPQNIPLPLLTITEDNMHPVLFELLKEMWVFEDYKVSEHDKNVFIKDITKDSDDPINHKIHYWLKNEYEKSSDGSGFSHYFEFRDKVYQVGLMVID